MQNLLGEEYLASARIPVHSAWPKDTVALERKVAWFDHRQTCRHVLQSLEDGEQPASLTTCYFYRAGKCAMELDHVMCAFLEDGDSEVWKKAQDWRYVVGVGAVHRSLWKSYGLK